MKTNSGTPRTLYLGLDVHKAQTVIATLEDQREAKPEIYGSVTTSQHALERVIRRIAKARKLPLNRLHVCYEASGCGFWIARLFDRLGIRCDVIAPSLIPAKAGDRIKTDKRDAARLAKHLRSNDLVAVHVPDSTDEAIRDLCRARTDAVDDLRRAKTRLLALLRRLGFNYSGKTHWTEAHKRYLRELRLPDAAHRVVMEHNLAQIDQLIERIADFEAAMLNLLEDWNRRPLVEAVMCFKGFKVVAAMIAVSEIGTFSRFEHPKKLMGYLGLVPTENSSGGSRKQGGISKCGNPHARWIMVEEATQYRHDPRVSAQLSKRQEGQAQWIKDLSWRAQLRLNRRFKQLSARRLHYNRTKVAIAREMVAFLWELGNRIEAQQPAA